MPISAPICPKKPSILIRKPSVIPPRLRRTTIIKKWLSWNLYRCLFWLKGQRKQRNTERYFPNQNPYRPIRHCNFWHLLQMFLTISRRTICAMRTTACCKQSKSTFRTGNLIIAPPTIICKDDITKQQGTTILHYSITMRFWPASGKRRAPSSTCK